MSSYVWSIEDRSAEQDLAVLSEGVTRHGRMEAAGGNPRPIACFLRNGSEIVAGASGRTEFDRLFIAYLWVADYMRGRGVGGEVLRRLETAAKGRGARDALIETLSDVTANLYRRWGYVEIASVPRYVGEFDKHILLKRL